MAILASTSTSKKMVVDTIEEYLGNNPQGITVTVSSSEPSSPKVGDVWYDTSA